MTVIRDRTIEDNNRLQPLQRFNANVSFLDRCFALRDRVFASAWFQRWAAGFPLTGMIARRQARALFDICAGFVYSQVLYACVELRLFEALSEGPQTAEQLAQKMGISDAAAERLLAAAVSLKLVARRGRSRYGLAMLGAALAGNRGIAEMVLHHRHLYADLADPVALLRGERRQTALSRYWPYADASQPKALAEDEVAAYSTLMSASLAMIAEDVLDAYPLQRHQCLLDVGGGEGTFLRATAKRAERLQLRLFDLPPVAARAHAKFAEDGLLGRAQAVGGDFLADPLPKADVVSLIRVILDHDDATALAILRAVRKALPADGVVLLAEPMAGTPGAEAMGDAYFGFYLLAMGRGRPRTAEQLIALFETAGFPKAQTVPMRRPFLARLIVARARS